MRKLYYLFAIAIFAIIDNCPVLAVKSNSRSHKLLLGRNFNKIFEQYMKEAQIYLPAGNETLIENHFSVDEDAIIDCEVEAIAFEFVYDHVLFAPHNVLESIGNVQSVTECQAYCKNSSKCKSFVFYDGGCIFLSATGDMLPAEQNVIPATGGNYIYGEKYCQQQSLKCSSPSQYNRFPQYKINSKFILKAKKAASRRFCYELCLNESEFVCRSANYNETSKACELSDMNRFTVVSSNVFQRADNVTYIENNCIYEPRERCHFKPLKGRLPRHVDAFYEVDLPDDCKTLCLNASFACRSYSILNKKLCLLTQDTEKTRLAYDKPLSYPIEEAVTYEKLDCFDIALDCRKDAMILRANSSKLFSGKLYSKGSPVSCVADVVSSMNFELKVPYNDISCGVSQVADGYFIGDFVIQHLKHVLTVNDVWVAASCQFDLKSQTIMSEQGYAMLDSYALKNSEGATFGKNEYKIDIHVEKPTIRFSVMHENLTELSDTPNIGDPLAVVIKVANESSPYDIFIRDLVAFDSEGVDEIQLIDEYGCPTEPSIMGTVQKVQSKLKQLYAPFAAFKFAASDTVQFRTLVSLCIPRCEPVNCKVSDGYHEDIAESRGRRRRRELGRSKAIGKKDILLSHTFKVGDIKILDGLMTDTVLHNGLTPEEQRLKNSYKTNMHYISFDDGSSCTNQSTYMFIGAIIIALEVMLTIFWIMCCSNRKQ